MELYNEGDGIVGKRLIAMGRDVSKSEVVPGSGRHRAQRVRVKGYPAKCYIDVALDAV